MGRSFDEFLRYLFLFIALICLSLINATPTGGASGGTSAGHVQESYLQDTY